MDRHASALCLVFLGRIWSDPSIQMNGPLTASVSEQTQENLLRHCDELALMGDTDRKLYTCALRFKIILISRLQGVF